MRRLSQQRWNAMAEELECCSGKEEKKSMKENGKPGASTFIKRRA
jgi:hypothetical protein